MTGESLARNTSSNQPTDLAVGSRVAERGAPGRRRGITGLPPGALAKRAQPTTRRAGGAHGGAQFHQRRRKLWRRFIIRQQRRDIGMVAGGRRGAASARPCTARATTRRTLVSTTGTAWR